MFAVKRDVPVVDDMTIFAAQIAGFQVHALESFTARAHDNLKRLELIARGFDAGGRVGKNRVVSAHAGKSVRRKNAQGSLSGRIASQNHEARHTQNRAGHQRQNLPVRKMNVIHEHDSAGSAVSILGGARLRRAQFLSNGDQGSTESRPTRSSLFRPSHAGTGRARSLKK